jgi:hypothetical protein
LIFNLRYVPASYTAKVKRDEQARADLVKQRAQRKVDLKAKREQWRSRAQKYHENFNAQNLNLVKERRLVNNLNLII